MVFLNRNPFLLLSGVCRSIYKPGTGWTTGYSSCGSPPILVYTITAVSIYTAHSLDLLEPSFNLTLVSPAYATWDQALLFLPVREGLERSL